MYDVEELKSKYHSALQLTGTEEIFVTDGTYEIIRAMNQKMRKEEFIKVFDIKNNQFRKGHENEVFGNHHNCNKFLIEIKKRTNHNQWVITHFVSFDTNKMEIYDPLNIKGAILGNRDSNDICFILSDIKYDVDVYIKTVWKLVSNQKRKFHLVSI